MSLSNRNYVVAPRKTAFSSPPMRLMQRFATLCNTFSITRETVARITILIQDTYSKSTLRPSATPVARSICDNQLIYMALRRNDHATLFRTVARKCCTGQQEE